MRQKNKPKSSSNLNNTNKFFIENTIQPMSRLLSSHSHLHLQSAHDRNYDSVGHSQRESQSQQMYRTQRGNSEVFNQTNSQSRMKLNPKQFQHRQVFNTKLYHENPSIPQNNSNNMKKFFKIQITKQQRQQSNLKLGDQVGQYFSQFSKQIQKINYHNNQNLKQQWKAVQHHVTLLQSHVSMLGRNQPIKIMVAALFNVFQGFLGNLSGLLSSSKESLRNQSFQLLANNSAKINMGHDSKQLKNTNRSQISKRLSGSQSANKLNGQPNQQQLDHKQHSIFTLTQFIKSQKQKINQLQFSTKIQYLKIQSLQQQLQNKNLQINKLQQENAKMGKQIQGIQKIKQEYQYKIRKFKEELEVAHIVKQQNLEDKVNYILGWKL